MKIEIESTTEIIELNGAPVRVWTGKTKNGIKVRCFIAAVSVLSTNDTSQFKNELIETKTPKIKKL